MAHSDTYKEIAQRLGSAAKMAKVDRARVLKELRALRDNAKAERNKEAERLASMYLAGLNRANTTEDDWEEADMATSKILDVLHGEYARPGAKAKFAVSITGRRGRQPGIPGGWLTGTWDGGKWAALVFAEASAAEYGLPEFRNISKFWIADKQGKTIVNYDRGWDVKPATPEARQAFMEIGRVASAEASKMPASRPGAKAKMAANEVPLNKPFTIRGKQVIVRTAHPDGWYEIFPTSGAYSLGKVNTLNREAVMQAMEAQNRKSASQLLSLMNGGPGAKVANAIREGEKVSASDDAVSRKIRKWMDEGKPQKQAVAIALDLERRGL